MEIQIGDTPAGSTENGTVRKAMTPTLVGDIEAKSAHPQVCVEVRTCLRTKSI